MQCITQTVSTLGLRLIETLRAHLLDLAFVARHRQRAEDFTRQRQLNFRFVMLFILQKTVKSIQRHLTECLKELAAGASFGSVTPGAWSHARAKLKHTAFIELNRDCLLPLAYEDKAFDSPHRWRGHRLLGVDGSLVRLPNTPEIGEKYGWKEVSNQNGATGTRFPEGRMSVLYDVLKRIGLDARLEPSKMGEVALAIEQLQHLGPGDIAINDRGFSGYVYFASILQQGAHFMGRCSTGSFLQAQNMFRLDRANQSHVVWLFAPADQKAECQRLGLPLKIKVRFVSVRLPTKELEVLATSLLEEELYPTEEFLTVYHWRWNHETYYLMLKGRLDLENFSGQTVEAVEQDLHAAVLLANLESLLSQPVQATLTLGKTSAAQSLQVNHAVSYHALKTQLFEMLYQDIPAQEVLGQLLILFAKSPVAVRPDRKVPPRCKRMSYHRSYHYQRRVKKVVF
jgi:hypothetical protein